MDFNAAAYLLSQGANLNTISDMISREISPQQVALLNDMIQASTRYSINGIDVVLTMVSTNNYVHDLAFLVQKIVKMENLEAIFMLARMGHKIYVIARSRIPEVDVGKVLSCFGGGGHSYAASANIKNLTLAQTEQQILNLLYKNIKSRRLAKDFMSFPPITITPEMSCKEA
ncbi:DHHA1 domain-containing protein, partial [Desulfobacterales bacterium HSG16]|nr:DHHA1 domain-containing protein [Desulfobacterales bacterium HSG16]